MKADEIRISVLFFFFFLTAHIWDVMSSVGGPMLVR